MTGRAHCQRQVAFFFFTFFTLVILTYDLDLQTFKGDMMVLNCVPKGLTGKQLDCAHPLVLNKGAPISWARSIMSVYDEATPYVTIWRYLNLAI